MRQNIAGEVDRSFLEFAWKSGCRRTKYAVLAVTQL